jgi:hypothetical protein
VRQTPTDRLRPVIGNFLERILVGLPGRAHPSMMKRPSIWPRVSDRCRQASIC